MGRSVTASLVTFAKNLRYHAKGLFSRKETPKKAFQGVTKDARKLAKSFTYDEDEEAKHRRVRKLINKGRKVYNAHGYKESEHYFRKAIHEDNRNAWAHAYLAYSLYQQGRFKDAAAYWKRAIEIDPDSEAARKAEQKLRAVERRTSETVAELEDRLE